MIFFLPIWNAQSSSLAALTTASAVDSWEYGKAPALSSKTHDVSHHFFWHYSSQMKLAQTVGAQLTRSLVCDKTWTMQPTISHSPWALLPPIMHHAMIPDQRAAQLFSNWHFNVFVFTNYMAFEPMTRNIANLGLSGAPKWLNLFLTMTTSRNASVSVSWFLLKLPPFPLYVVMIQLLWILTWINSFATATNDCYS